MLDKQMSKQDEEWPQLSPRQQMFCYDQVCKSYRNYLKTKEHLDDEQIRAIMIYDSIVDEERLVFYFLQRYPRAFHMLTNRRVPNWYWQDFMRFIYQSLILVEDGIMTKDERQIKIEEKLFELRPPGDQSQVEESFKTYSLFPRKFELTPEMEQAIRQLRALKNK